MLYQCFSIIILAYIYTIITQSLQVHVKFSYYECTYATKLMKTRVFYKVPFSDISIFIDSNKKEDINRSLVSRHKYEFYGDVPSSCFMRSIVYVVTYENAFLARIPALHYMGILPHDEFYTDKIRLSHKTVGNCLYAVFYNQEYTMFGHLIHDFLASMMFVPEYVNKSGFTVIAPLSGKEMAISWCNLLGINAKIVSLAENEQIQASKLFLISGRKPAHSVTVGGIKKLRKYIEKRLNLSNIIPKKYVLGNRPRTAYRSIINIDQLYESIKKINENFILQENVIENVEENAKFWSDIKIYVGPCGSNIYNSVFMRDNTGLCLLFSHMDLPNVHLCITSNFYMIGLVQQCFRRDNFENYDIQLFIRYVKSVIYCVDNKRWPSDIDIDSPLVSRFPFEYNDPLPDLKNFVGL